MSKMLPNKKVIVVLPAYNAAKTLEKTFHDIPKDWVDQIILVDDVSKDNTVKVAERLGITTFVHEKNRGYGGNQKTCYREALKLSADIVLMVHPDFQYDPTFIPEMIKPIIENGADSVFGSRMIVPKNALAGGMPYWKFVANIFLTKLENLALGMKLSEYHSGFRAYSRKILEKIPIELNSDGFVFDTEIIAQMKVAGFSIKEIPISTRYFPGASMIGFLRSTEYGVRILLVMAHYLLHKFHIRTFPQFETIIKNDLPCVNCGNQRLQLAIQGNINLSKVLKNENYSITDFNNGKFENVYRCIQCDLYFVDRSHLQNDLENYYKNQALDAVYLSNEEGRRKTARKILQRLTALRGSLVGRPVLLDVGCGPGIFLSEAKKAGWAVSGIDLSVKNIDFARNNFKISTIMSGSAEAINSQFPDSYFDVVTAFDVVEHLGDPKRIFNLIYSKLKPSGALVITVPLVDSLVARWWGKRWHGLLPSHLNYFTAKSLRNFCESLGYEIIHQRSYTRHLSLDYLLKRLLKKPDFFMPKILNFTAPVNLFDETELYLKKK